MGNIAHANSLCVLAPDIITHWDFRRLIVLKLI